MLPAITRAVAGLVVSQVSKRGDLGHPKSWDYEVPQITELGVRL